MKPIDQTIMHTETTKGNCMAACVASMLEIDIAIVPNFAESRYWEQNLIKWLKENYKLSYIEVQINDSFTHLVKSQDVHHLIIGPSPRGPFYHAVVGRAGEIVHDPHPSKSGLKEMKTYGFFIVS